MASKPGVSKGGSYRPSRGRFAGQTFASYRQYQNANAKAKGFTSAAARLASPKKQHTTRATTATQERAVKALLALRRDPDLTIAQASKKAGTTPAAVRRYGAANLEKQGGRLQVKARDTLAVEMQVVTPGGMAIGVVKGSRQRNLIGQHAAAVGLARDYPSPRNIARLRRFRGKTVTFASGERVEFLSEVEDLRRLGRLGKLASNGPYDVGEDDDSSSLETAA